MLLHPYRLFTAVRIFAFIGSSALNSNVVLEGTIENRL